MKVILGLGNPGKTYEHTRHNVGFLVLDEIARRANTTFGEKKSLEAEIVEVTLKGERVLLVKPQTFMNVSGRSLAAILSKYPVSAQDVLVIYDDADLAFADIRFKAGGSSAGHNGMQSILEVFPKGTSVPRIRIGIGRPTHPDIPLDVFVLQSWTTEEMRQLQDILDTTIHLIEHEWL
ncbi:aminoacyl-tRNA hydrolase [Candidatus Uhrbacteria bacterium CG_4_9_14_3_um_filter_50_9]|uniref:Peptidyl-tRNA hydrolase n=1 Tax=Candidatus Uhrbacteria bacterium CG_4_9_14_3_um_filter_50_9 TaxID=1975035 RepID=A0A2M7XAW0_9BACT|nr:MAG: aminoacyl-tRNA hydrolase [Candidatus Uhrbacteria bacterium CG_4_9_14_3_um_filter_50_9]